MGHQARFYALCAGVAQLVEQLICNQQVGGSNPSTSSTTSYGGIPERSNGADCKSVVYDFGGSNPPSPTKKVPAIAGAFFILINKILVNFYLFYKYLVYSYTVAQVFLKVKYNFTSFL